MSVIEIGKSKSTSSFKIGTTSSSKSSFNVTEFNNKLRDAAKSGEKVDFKLLGQISDTERIRVDSKALKEYVQKHSGDKAHIQEMFSSSSPLSALYTDTEGFSPKDSWLSGLVGKLLSFLSNPSLATLKGIAKGLVSEDGKKINLSNNKLLEELDRNQKLAPLAAALRIVGMDEAGAQMKEELTTNPEAGKAYKKETIDAYVTQSLNRLKHIFDDEGNIISSSSKDGLLGPLNITAEDIQALKADDQNSLTVSQGLLKWNDFVAKTYKYFAAGQAGSAVDYVNTVFAIFNRQVRENIDKATDPVEKENFKAQGRELINIFSEQLATEFGGEGFAKAFELALTRGAFASETARNAIVGDAATTATTAAITQVTNDLTETANVKTNALSKQDKVIDALIGTNGKYTILDLGKVCEDKEGTIIVKEGIVNENLIYDGNKLTLATAAEAYKKSAEVLSQEASKVMAKSVLDANLGDTKARDEYLANAKKVQGKESKGIQDDASKISEIAKDKTKNSNEMVAVIQISVESIKEGDFLINTVDDVAASDKFAKNLSERLVKLANIRVTKDNQADVDTFTTTISAQARSGDFDIAKILNELIKIEPAREIDIQDRIRAEFKDESKVKAFITTFINNEEMVSLANVVKAETIQDLVKSNTAISDYLIRQTENKALSVSSLEDIINDPQKLADASPELACIFASADSYKSDSVRAEMAMLGLMSILKSNPTLLSPGSSSAKNIAKKLFAKQVSNDEGKANRIADKLAQLVQTATIQPKGITGAFDLEKATRLAGTSVSRAKYLEFKAPEVAYAREAITADRLARMINAHTPESARGTIHSTVEALAQHLESAASKLDGAGFDDIRTIVTEGLSGLQEQIVKNMFFPGDDADPWGKTADRLTGNSAVQSVIDAALRMKMILPRLYRGEGSSSSSQTVRKPESTKVDSQATTAVG